MLQVEVKDSYMWEEVHQQHLTIQKCVNENQEKLKGIAEEVNKRGIKTVVFVGRGSSEHAMQVGRYFFEIECGFLATICNPSVFTLYNSKMDLSNCLVIGMSQCGEAKDVYTVLQNAKQQGAVVVSVTNSYPCLMSEIQEYYINMEIGKENSYTAAKSYLAEVAILLELGAMIGGNQDKLETILDCGELIKQCYEMEGEIRESLPMFRNADSIMILGRGYSYAVALETELKIQEASYTSGRAYSSADYQHGPIATTPRFTPFIFYLTDAKTDESTVMLINKLRENFHISALIVTNKKEYASLGDYAVVVDEKFEGYKSVFALALFSQMFSCLLSFARGYHPDKPTLLSKVTVTY